MTVPPVPEAPPRYFSWKVQPGRASPVTESYFSVRFTNMPDGTLLIRKVCSVNPSITLQNAEFKVAYADGSVIGESNGIYRTDENGEIRITGLKPGKSVVVTETRAPDGFILDTQSQTVQVKEGKHVGAGRVHDIPCRSPGFGQHISAGSEVGDSDLTAAG